MRNLFVVMFMLAATVFAGVLMVVVVVTPSLYEKGMSTIPAAAGLGMLLAVPVAWLVARAIIRTTSAA